MEALIADVKRLRDDVDRIMRTLMGSDVTLPKSLYSLIGHVNEVEKDAAELNAFIASQPK